MIDRIFIDEEQFYERGWGKVFLIFIPFVIGFSYIGLLFLILPELDMFLIIGGAILTYFFPPFGKETVIPTTILLLRNHLAPAPNLLLVAGSIAFIDVINSYFLMWNFYLIKKIPKIGEWIDEFQDYSARKMEKNQWLKNLAFFSVASFVVFPFQGSGGVGASILGRVLGLKKFYAWIAIIIGSFVGCFLLGILSLYMGEALLDIFERNIFAGIGALIAIIVVFIFFYHTAKTRLFEDQ